MDMDMNIDMSENDMHIALEWAMFDSRIIPPSASERQRNAIRRAYFAGAAAVISILHELDEGKKTAETVVDALTGLNQEIYILASEVTEIRT
jgi:hypothetical protein